MGALLWPGTMPPVFAGITNAPSTKGRRTLLDLLFKLTTNFRIFAMSHCVPVNRGDNKRSMPRPTKTDGCVLVAYFCNVSFQVSRMSHTLSLVVALEVSTRLGRSARWVLLWLRNCRPVLDVLSAV